MISSRRLLAGAWLACLLGCSAAHGTKSTPLADAAADGRGGVDAHAVDAHAAADSRAADGHAHDATARIGDARNEADVADAVTTADATRDAPTALDARDADAKPAQDAAPDAGPPTATTLTLSLPLVPPFSTSIHDYYVRCPAESNALVVAMTAAPGSTIGLLQPVTTAPAVENLASFSVAASGAIVVGLTTAGTTDQYWIRCLPYSFPQMDMTLHPDAGTPTPGYYLVGNTVPQEGSPAFAILLDGNGVPLWYDQGGLYGVYDVGNLTAGTISFSQPGTEGPQFALLDLPAGTTSSVMPSGLPSDFHELQVLKNGDYIVMADPIITGVDLTGLGSFGADESVIGCVIQEIDATGAAVWQWDVTEHFDAVKDSRFAQGYYSPGGGGLVVDPFHCNSIDIDDNGDLLVSARNMDSVFLISKATGAVLWKMGGATFSTDNAQYIAVQDDPMTSFHRQHDARFQAGSTLSMFDDQTQEPGPARAVVYSYDVAAGTASIVWQYLSTETAQDMGSFRILPDGSRVVGWGFSPGAHPVFSEVTESGQDLLDFSFDDTNWTYRAVKIPTTAFDLSVLHNTAGGT